MTKILYKTLVYVALPLVLLRLLWRSIKVPGYRKRWLERFGIFPPLDGQQTIWVHAVSVGESQAAAGLIKWLQHQYPEFPVVVTTTTPTGSERVGQLFGDGVQHVYFPYDIPWAINGFLRRTSPRLLLLMETEVWPNLLAACEADGIQTVLVNARLSERSASRYVRWGEFTRETFQRIGVIAAQGKADASRFRELGAAPEKVVVTGSIKFDAQLPVSLHEQAEVVRFGWGNRPTWVAGSTHEGEEIEILKAHREILQLFSEALLVLVPRHPERFDRVAEYCLQAKLNTIRRSDGQPCDANTEVLLCDTMGELPLFIAATDITFIGGSLVPRGGHNVLEAAALGKPVLFGPHMMNFAEISQQLLRCDAGWMVQDWRELANTVTKWLGEADERSRIGENGLKVVEENRGALEQLFQLIRLQLPVELH